MSSRYVMGMGMGNAKFVELERLQTTTNKSRLEIDDSKVLRVTKKMAFCSSVRDCGNRVSAFVFSFVYFSLSVYRTEIGTERSAWLSLVVFDGTGRRGTGSTTGQYGRPTRRAATGHGSCKALMAHWRPYSGLDWPRSRSPAVRLPIKPSQMYHSH